jgi:L-threonylcarbamoyladenylate synthase
MRTAKLNDKNSKKILSEVERILRLGGLVIVPTDTVYGIIGDATKAEAVKKIFAVKKRPREKVFPIFVKNVNEARKIAYIADAKAKFLERIWPGPLTVVFQHKEKLPKILTGGKDTVGIRMPNNSFLLELLSRLDFPLFQTSANISEKPPAKNIEEIKEYFGKAEAKPDLVVDGGELKGKSSTVIDYTGKEPMILRVGLVKREELDRILESIKK